LGAIKLLRGWGGSLCGGEVLGSSSGGEVLGLPSSANVGGHRGIAENLSKWKCQWQRMVGIGILRGWGFLLLWICTLSFT